jgi:hypothetical protein
MTAPVVTVPAGTPVTQIAQTLRRHRVSAVPVLDEAGGVVGLVSEYDLLARSGLTARDVMTSAAVSVTEDTAGPAMRWGWPGANRNRGERSHPRAGPLIDARARCAAVTRLRSAGSASA